MIKKYRKKPVVIEALKYDGSNIEEAIDFIGEDAYFKDSLIIETLEGKMRADIGDYIIKGVNGEFYPCKPEIFSKTHEEVIEDE